MTNVRINSMGWKRDYPDIRDVAPLSNEVPKSGKKRAITNSVREMLGEVGLLTKSGARGRTTASKAKLDLRLCCSPIEDQGNIGSCTAHAVIGLVEYFERQAFGVHLDASRLFLYKATRNLLRWEGDQGAYLRSAIGALALFGVPPEEYWPYDESRYDEEPSAFCYSFAQNYQAIKYYRLDPPEKNRKELLADIKDHLVRKLPLVFGFTVYDSLDEAHKTGMIPFPSQKDRVQGGHAVMAVGYDDSIKIKNRDAGSPETKGAILIRNSWGPDWGGNGGYLWLPYEYVLRGLADDWWTLLKNEWIATGQFGQ